MISTKELLGIICTEAIEYGGIQEVPLHKDGATQSFHAPKRAARGPESSNGEYDSGEAATVVYSLRLVLEDDGKLNWKD